MPFANMSMGYAVREFSRPMRHMYKCKVGLRIVEGPGFMQLERCGLHHRQSYVTPPCRSFLGSFEDDDVPEPLVYSSDENKGRRG
jgi:hypothetical protein